MLAAWAADYVGIPWRDGGRDRKGCDCYGLLALAYRDVYGIRLPTHSAEYATAEDRQEVAVLLGDSLPREHWRPVALADAHVGDGLLFRIAGEPCHVGLYVGEGRFLHVRPVVHTCIERLESPAWARRFLGAYRHEALA